MFWHISTMAGLWWFCTSLSAAQQRSGNDPCRRHERGSNTPGHATSQGSATAELLWV